jgi:hypothetical protein
MTDQVASGSLWKNPVLSAALFATALTSVVTFFLFRLIHEFTHHRPLGAATLAVMVVTAFFGLFAVGARLRVSPTVARAALGVALVTIAALAFVG